MMIYENVFTLGETELCSGIGDLREGSLCVMAGAAAIHAVNQGTPLSETTDELECACPVVRALCIARNDSFNSDRERTEWGHRLIPYIIGSRVDPRETAARATRCADVAIREILPLALRSAGLEDEATKLYTLPEILTLSDLGAASDAVTRAARAGRAATLAADAAYVAALATNAALAATDAALAATDAALAATDAALAALADTDAATDETKGACKIIDNLIHEFLGIDDSVTQDTTHLGVKIPIPT